MWQFFMTRSQYRHVDGKVDSSLVSLVSLQSDHDRRHDLTRLAPGDVAYAQLGEAMSRGSTDGPVVIADAQQTRDAAAHLWEEVCILAHGSPSASRMSWLSKIALMLHAPAARPACSDTAVQQGQYHLRCQCLSQHV